MRCALLLGFVAAAQALTVDSNGCVTFDEATFDKDTDYLPYKTNAVGGEKWGIEYGNWWKRLNVSYVEGGETKERVYQLVQCFAVDSDMTAALAETPDCVAPACNRIQIPVRSVGIADNTRLLGMFEALNILDKITYVSDSVTSPCLQSRETTPANPGPTQVSNVDAYFVDTLPAEDSPKYVKVSLAEEQDPEFRAAWIEFVALFFNMEHEANYIGETTQLVYDAQSHHIASTASAKKRIGWVKNLNSGSIEFTDSPYIKYLIEAAHGVAAEFGKTIDMSAAAHLDAFKTIDILIVEPVNDQRSRQQWLTTLNIAEGTSDVGFMTGTTLSIYQVRKYSSPDRSSNDFNEQAAAAPDLVLSDIIKATHNIDPWTGVEMVFLRHYTEGLVLLNPSADVCGKGIYRPFDVTGVRKVVLSRLETVAVNPTDGVTNCMSFVDYFPTKVDPTHAEDFTVSYHLTWKLVRNLRVSESYILLLKGCDESHFPSAHVLPSAKRFHVPIDSVATSQTIDITIIQMLGEIGALKKAASTPSPCILKGIETGLIAPLLWNSPASDYTSAELATSFYTQTPSNYIASTASADEGALNRVDWLLFFSAFFNKEALGYEVSNNIKSRFLCVKQKGAQASAANGKPSVAKLSKSYWGGKYAANVNAVWVEMVEEAGGVMGPVTAGNSAMEKGTLIPSGTHVTYADDAALREALVDVDVLIDNNYHAGNSPATPVGIDDALAAYGLTTNDTEFKFIQNKAVYRLDRRMDTAGSTAWFGRGVTDADAVVRDFINMVHPGFVGDETHLYFGRNLFRDDSVVHVTGDSCTNPYGILPPLTNDGGQCEIQCSDRLTQEYCSIGCLWTNNNCIEIPTTPAPTSAPVIVYVGSAGSAVPSMLVTLMVVLAMFMF